jgi:hypothetical protein
MAPKRVLVGYGIDVDAVSGWYINSSIPSSFSGLTLRSYKRINTRDGSAAGPTDVSRGVYGATVGTERLLKLWDKYGIKTTWFIPAHSIESFPNEMAKVRDAGHEM